ncbi:MAG: hypothetical protein GXP46_03595 [Deferribacteres bacterium]|nr:hypothetical protein [Deferribacteres bacterium]
MFPFANLTDSAAALKESMPVLVGRLEEKGYEVVGEDALYDMLCRKRIRYTGYVPAGLAREIKDGFGVSFILTGAVVSFSAGKNPQVGLLSRLIDASDGAVVWADYASVTGDDFAGILETGKIRTVQDLVPEAVDRLLASFSTSRSRKDAAFRVAVLPFLNRSKFRNAGMISTYLLLVDMLKNSRFVPVEYGNVREVIVDRSIRSRGELDFEDMRALSRALNVEGIVVGTVERYSASDPPAVAVTVRLLDARNNRILWYNSHQLTGEDDIVVFDRGRIRTVDKVAYRAVSELVERMQEEVNGTMALNQ